MVTIGVSTPHTSETVAVPNAESMAVAEGLQPNVSVVPVAVMTGATESMLHEMLRETDAATFPHASVAFQVLV